MLACGSFGTTSPSPPTGGDASADATTSLLDAGPGGAKSGACAKLFFEDSFERGDLKGLWDRESVPTRQSIRIGLGPGREGSAMRVDVDADAAVEFRNAYLEKQLPTKDGGCLSVSFALRVDQFPTTDAIVIAALEMDASALLVSISASGKVALAEQGPPPARDYRTIVELGVPPKQWHDVVLTLRGSSVVMSAGASAGGGSRNLGATPALLLRAGVPNAKQFAASYLIDDVFVFADDG